MSATQIVSYEASIPRTILHRIILIPRLATRYRLSPGNQEIHFALETPVDEIASSIQRFLDPVR